MNRTLAMAFRGCGLKVLGMPHKAASMEFLLERFPVTVAVKMITDDERMDKWPGMAVQAMLRVDVSQCGRLGLPVGLDLDRWILKQEDALHALVVPLEGQAPPFPGKRLHLMPVNPSADSWSLHISTSGNGRFRDSKWLVAQ